MNDNYPKLINITLGQAPGNMIINGQPQMITVSVIACPECNTVIQAFNSQLPNIEVIKWINANPDLENSVKYCPHCGQQLMYPKIIEYSEK